MSRVLALLLTSLVATTQGVQPCLRAPEPLTLNVNEYLGTWYELASSIIPKFTFERDLECITATYTAIPGVPYLTVTNAGRLESGEVRVLPGFAYPLEPVSPEGTTVARLAVSFGPPPAPPTPATRANYIVIYRGTDAYQTAVVTDEDKATVFFLSRTATVPDQEWKRMKKAAEANGLVLDVIGLIRTVQDEARCAAPPAPAP